MRILKAIPILAMSGFAFGMSSEDALSVLRANSPNIDALYQSHLKTHEEENGCIIYEISVNESGKVLSATPVKSEIRSKDLINSVSSYFMSNVSFSAATKGTPDKVNLDICFRPTDQNSGRFVPSQEVMQRNAGWLKQVLEEEAKRRETPASAARP